MWIAGSRRVSAGHRPGAYARGTPGHYRVGANICGDFCLTPGPPAGWFVFALRMTFGCSDRLKLRVMARFGVDAVDGDRPFDLKSTFLILSCV